MRQYFEIADVKARVIAAAGGESTVEAEVTLDDTTTGRASVPGGMLQAKPAIEAAANINIEISEALIAMDALSQPSIDRILLDIDGTENGSRLGANAIMAVSLACAKAAAESAGLSLYNYIGGVNAKTIPELLCGVSDQKTAALPGNPPPAPVLSMLDYPTLTSFLDAVAAARRRGESVVLTAGEAVTEDPVLADIAVAVNAEAVSAPSLAVCNQLLRIDEELA